MAAARRKRLSWIWPTVLWGLAIAVSVCAFMEWQARRNCLATLALLNHRTSTGRVSELALDEAKTLLLGQPEELSRRSTNAKSIIYSWHGVLRSHHVRVGLKDTDNVATVSPISSLDFAEFVARSAEPPDPMETQSNRPAGSPVVAKAGARRPPKRESRSRQPTPSAVLGNGDVQRPTTAELASNAKAMQRFQERFAAGARSSLPAGPDVYVDRQFVSDQEQWYRDTHLAAFDQFGTKDPAWNDEARQFIGLATRAIIARRLRQSKGPGNVPVDLGFDLTKQVLDTGCRDPLVLSLCAQLWPHSQSREAAQQHAQAAVELFEKSDYPLEASFGATLQAAQLATSLADREAWNAQAATQMLGLLRNRQYQPIERRILLASFQPVVDRFLGQQHALFAKQLASGQTADDWLTSMLLGRFKLRLASDVMFFWFATGIQNFTPDSPETQTIFQEFALAAAAHFMQAWQLDPQLPEASVDMIRFHELHPSLAAGSHRFWFDQAVQAHFDHAPAYRTMRRALTASRAFDELLDLGRECLATGRFDTSVPDEFQRAAANAVQRERRRSPNWYSELYEEYHRWYEGYLVEPSSLEEQAQRKSRLLAAAWLSGRHDEVKRSLSELGPDLKVRPIQELQVRLSDIRRAADGQLSIPFAGHHGAILSLAPGTDGRSLITAATDGIIRFWTKEGRQTHSVQSDGGGPITATAFSSEGAMIATVADGPQVVIRHTQSRTVHTTLEGSLDVQALEFSRDGSTLAVGGMRRDDNSHEIELWNVSSGSRLAVLSGLTGPIQDLEFSPIANVLVSVTGREPSRVGANLDIQLNPHNVGLNEIIVWDLAADRPLERLVPFAPVVHNVAFSPDGRFLAAAGQDWYSAREYFRNVEKRNVIRLLDTASWQIVATMNGHQDVITTLSFSGDGQLLVSGSADRSVRCWDADSGQEKAVFKGHNHPVRSLSMTGESQFVSADEQGRMLFWNLAPQVRSHVRGPALDYRLAGTNGLQGLPDGSLATCGEKDGVTVWRAAEGLAEGSIFQGNATEFINAFDFAFDGRLLVTAGGTASRFLLNPKDPRGEVIFWDTAQSRIMKRLDGLTGSIFCAAFSPDGKSLATGSSDGTVVIWNVRTGKPYPWGNLREHHGAITALAFSPDGRTLVTGSRSKLRMGQWEHGHFRVWTLPTQFSSGTPLRSQSAQGGFDRLGVMQLDFSGDGVLLFAAHGDFIDVWDVASWRRVNSAAGRHFALAPDGETLAAGGGRFLGNEGQIWHIATGRELVRLSGGHQNPISAVTYLGNGEQLVTGSADGAAVGWDATTGMRLPDLEGAVDP